MDKGSDKIYINHILEAIALIQNFVAGKTLEDFSNDIMLQSAVSRQIEIIGEASKRLSEEFKNSLGQLPWRHITGMRDFLIHDYARVELSEVWNAATRDVEELKKALELAEQ